jgi:hypothetical protein
VGEGGTITKKQMTKKSSVKLQMELPSVLGLASSVALHGAGGAGVVADGGNGVLRIAGVVVDVDVGRGSGEGGGRAVLGGAPAPLG